MENHTEDRRHSLGFEKGTWCSEVQDKSVVSGLFLVKEKSFAVGKTGKAYLTLQLTDRTGSVDSRVWDNAEAVQLWIQTGDIVSVKGVGQSFQSRTQLVIHKIDKWKPEGDVPEGVFTRASRLSVNELEAKLIQLVDGLSDGPVRALLKLTLADEEVMRLFRIRPAAKTIHHAYKSGLIEHVVSIAELLVSLHSHYRIQGVDLRLDLLVFGAIYHDIGKIWELEGDGPYQYSDRGRLVGHMALGLELIDRYRTQLPELDNPTADLLKHIVLGHHGKLEYGSPKEPVFLEAILVAMIDDLDSKMNSIAQFIEAEKGNTTGKWSRVHPQLGRHLLLRTESENV